MRWQKGLSFRFIPIPPCPAQCLRCIAFYLLHTRLDIQRWVCMGLGDVWNLGKYRRRRVVGGSRG